MLTSRDTTAAYALPGERPLDSAATLPQLRDRAIALAIIAIGIALSMLGPWEMDGESWGYWYFARLFNEGAGMATWDRAPIYVVYLSPFLKLGYPRGVVVEYVVTSAIFCASFLSLFYRTRLIVPAALAAVLLLPTVWTSPPNCQILGLACSFFAFAALGSSWPAAARAALALVLAALAYFFRSTYVFVLLLLVGYFLFSGFLEVPDRWRRIRVAGLAAIPAAALIVTAFVYVRTHQVEHPWNNVFLTSTQWFPVNVKSLFDSGFVSHMNWAYIAERYPQPQGIDFYRTNQELFNGAATAREAIAANPGFVMHTLTQNVLAAFETLGRLTSFPVVLYKLGIASSAVNFALGAIVAGLLAIIAFGRSFPVVWRVMVVALTGAALTSILSMPKSRYFVCVAPLLFFVAIWAVGTARSRFFVKGAALPGEISLLSGGLKYGAAVFCVFTAISYATMLAYSGMKTSARRAVLENTAGSMKAQYPVLSPLAADCRGILTLEHAFFAAFIARDGARVYDVFEVPPFGSLKNSSYSGLHPDRVDCVFVSDALKSGSSIGTDTYGRYGNYIAPYVDSLVAAGGVKSDIPGYGYMVRRKR